LAPEFLRFIREELIPMIDANYPTIKGDRGFFGDSLGGLEVGAESVGFRKVTNSGDHGR
jgi:predicted alpha/beta superfamily hydrolase